MVRDILAHVRVRDRGIKSNVIFLPGNPFQPKSLCINGEQFYIAEGDTEQEHGHAQTRRVMTVNSSGEIIAVQHYGTMTNVHSIQWSNDNNTLTFLHRPHNVEEYHIKQCTWYSNDIT